MYHLSETLGTLPSPRLKSHSINDSTKMPNIMFPQLNEQEMSIHVLLVFLIQLRKGN